MTTQVTLPYKRFSEISELEFENVCTVSVSLGCADFAKRDINGVGFPVYLSLKTPDGKFLGNGAYAGAVEAFPQDTLEKLWEASGDALDEDELYLSAGANEGDYLDEDGDAICSDCLSAGFAGFDEETACHNPEDGQACQSCMTMIEESLWDQLQSKEWAGII